MSALDDPGWKPTSPAALADQVAYYDRLRAASPLAPDGEGTWAVLGHAETLRVIEDHDTFSSVVSTRVVVPNGMDPPVHTVYREVIDRYFGADAMAAYEPVCRLVTEAALDDLPRGREVEVMTALADPLAVAYQCSFMGWPDELQQPLLHWAEKNHAATRSGHRQVMAAVALEFDDHIRRQLRLRRAAGGGAPDDPTTRLARDRVEGRPLTDEEIVSIVRNWTAGELGTIAAAIGIIAHHLAGDPALMDQLRERPSDIDRAVDEILRIRPPLIANRRRTTCPVTLAGQDLPADTTLWVVWASANRDESVMGDPDRFQLDRDPAVNLLYGRGIHYCPGEPLARLELRVFVETLLARVDRISVGEAEPVLEAFPAGGFVTLPLCFD